MLAMDAQVPYARDLGGTRPDGATQDGAPQAETELSFHYVVSAAVDPGILPRALELLAKRNLVPAECHAVLRTPADPDRPARLSIELRTGGLERMTAEHIAACLRMIHGVDSVLFWETA